MSAGRQAADSQMQQNKLVGMQRNIVPLIFNRVNSNSPPDEQSVMDQVRAVSSALKELGYTVREQSFSQISEDQIQQLVAMKPLFIFNLIESWGSSAHLSYKAPALFEAAGLPYTGCSARTLKLSTNKIAAKEMLAAAGIPTPSWEASKTSRKKAFHPDTYIVKPISEDASVGLGPESVMRFEDRLTLQKRLEEAEIASGIPHFAETYIPGREFSVSIFGREHPRILPPGEMQFLGYQETNRVEIVDYRAKWDEESFEYLHTVPIYRFPDEDRKLVVELKLLAAACWQEIKLEGYARVDFRVDANSQPWVLEVNANPCIAPPSSGFVRAAAEAGISYRELIASIAAIALQKNESGKTDKAEKTGNPGHNVWEITC